VVTIKQERSPIAEAYRVLGANIQFSDVDRPLLTILVNSGGPGEGKTITVANLGIALAQMGKRVVLVDADLRKPTLAKYFMQPNSRGLTSLLTTSNSRAVEFLLHTGVDNLALLASGPIPPNPAKLVGSNRMAEVIAQLKTLADVVIIDSPPSLVVADATLLARRCDAVLLVVSASATQAENLKNTKEQLAQSGTHLLGFVMNRATRPLGGYGYYYYGEEQKPSKKSWWRRQPPKGSGGGHKAPSRTTTTPVAAEPMVASTQETLGFP
jgi:capsular exopolysaccharide synthesis family protein